MGLATVPGLMDATVGPRHCPVVSQMFRSCYAGPEQGGPRLTDTLQIMQPAPTPRIFRKTGFWWGSTVFLQLPRSEPTLNRAFVKICL